MILVLQGQVDADFYIFNLFSDCGSYQTSRLRAAILVGLCIFSIEKKLHIQLYGVFYKNKRRQKNKLRTY